MLLQFIFAKLADIGSEDSFKKDEKKKKTCKNCGHYSKRPESDFGVPTTRYFCNNCGEQLYSEYD